MEQIIVTDVDAEDVEILWPKIRDYLASALEHGQGEYNIDDIHYSLLDGSMRLWILYNADGELLSSAVCEIRKYPQKTVCYVILTGGDSIEHWSYAMAAIEDWALQNGADAVAAYTRRGVAKMLQSSEFNTVYTVVQKELSERRVH